MNYYNKLDEYGDEFRCQNGSRKVSANCCAPLDVAGEIEILRQELESTGSDTKIKKNRQTLESIGKPSNRSGMKLELDGLWTCCRYCRLICVLWFRWMAVVLLLPI